MRTVISIPFELHQKLKVAAATRGVQIGEAAAEAVLNWLKAKPVKREGNGNGGRKAA